MSKLIAGSVTMTSRFTNRKRWKPTKCGPTKRDLSWRKEKGWKREKCKRMTQNEVSLKKNNQNTK